MNTVVSQPPRPPKDFNPAISDQLNHICMKALALDPRDRFQTAAELEVALEMEAQAVGGAVKQRDLAKFVSEMFAEHRAQTRSLIEAQLSKATAGSASEITPIALPAGISSVSNLQGAHANPRESHEPTVSPAAEAAPQKKRGPAVAGLAALLIVGVFGLRSFTSHEAPITEASGASATSGQSNDPATVSAAPQPSAVAHAEITLNIAASPPQTKLFLDNEPLPTNPAAKTLPGDGAVHVLRAEAKGYVSHVARIAANTDEHFELALERVRSADPPRRQASPPPPPARAVAPPQSPPKPAKPNCDQPFYVDARGIKVVIPECR
jgi:hypothetical protein